MKKLVTNVLTALILTLSSLSLTVFSGCTNSKNKTTNEKTVPLSSLDFVLCDGNRDEGCNIVCEESHYRVCQKEDVTLSGKLAIPNTYNGLPVKEIEQFAYCQNVTAISIPANLEYIEGFVFFDNLTSITVDKNNKNYYVKNNCLICPNNLSPIPDRTKVLVLACKNAVIPSDGSVITLGRGAFSGKGVKEITIPDTIRYVLWCAFMGCEDLTTVYWNATRCYVVGADYSCFTGCEKLENVIIGKNVQAIPAFWISGSQSLKKVVIPKNVTSVGYNAFDDCAEDFTIYCEIEESEKTSSWEDGWNGGQNRDYPVVWGYKG